MISRSLIYNQMQIEIKTKSKSHPLKNLYKPPPKEDYSTNFTKLIIVIIISFVFIAGQFVGGVISNSISVISDAFHLVTDLLGFIVSFVFIYYSRKTPTQVMSFGYHRMELLGALGNLFIIWALAIFLLYEATLRIINKQFVEQPLAMLIVASGGLVINIIMYFVLHTGGHSHGLMSQPCSHDHGDTQTNPFELDCCTSLCQNQQCLKLYSFGQHCHVKIDGEEQIHKHRKNQNLDADSSQLNLDILANKKKFKVHQHNQKCKKPLLKQNQQNNKKNQSSNIIQVSHKNCSGHDHNHTPEHDHNHQHQHQHNHDHDHDHKHDHEQGHQHEHKGGQSLSMKAAVLHALSDVIQSIGLLISSFIIFFVGSNQGSHVSQFNDWHYLDPISTYIFSIIVLCSTWPITKNCYYLIMQAVPDHLKIDQLQSQFEAIEGVIDVHDLHIWDLRPSKTILIAHVFTKYRFQRSVLTQLTKICRRKKIYHTTIQIQQQQYKEHDEYILCDQDIH